MTIEHRNIVDPNIHEPKGVGAASSGTVYVANGNGSGTWNIPQIQGQGAANNGTVPVKTGGSIVWWIPEIQQMPYIILRNTNSYNPPGGDGGIYSGFSVLQRSSASDFNNTASVVTVNTSGIYLVESVFQYGPTPASARVEHNNSNTFPVNGAGIFRLNSGATLRVRVRRTDSGGSNSQISRADLKIVMLSPI